MIAASVRSHKIFMKIQTAPSSSQQENPFGKCSHTLKCIVDASRESPHLPRTRSVNVSLSLTSALIKSAWALCDCLSVFIGGACQKVVSTAVMAPQCSA